MALCRRPRSARRGMLLAVVLVIIALLVLVGSSFLFRMNAELSAVGALNDLQQARLAADSGLARVILLLRDERTNMDAWHSNPEAFRRILVWARGREGGSESLADQEKIEGRPAWRFSVVSYELDGDESKIRYGITDEASKINLNTASRAQLLKLFDQLELGETEEVSPEQLADTLTDWLDEDDTPISLNGAEHSYYMTLNPPYRAKNRPLQSVEELLMVKGFDGQILYGEDYNRNGYLDENEDDGPEGVFPPDDGNGTLDRGILPLVTVYSWDWNWGNDNKYRWPLGGISSKAIDQLPRHVTDEVRPEVLEFIVEARQRGYKFRSAAELLNLQVYEDGTSNYTEAWQEYDRLVAEAQQDRLETEEREEEPEKAGQEGRDLEVEGRDGESGRQEDEGSDRQGGRRPFERGGGLLDRDREQDSRGDGRNADEDDEQDSKGRSRTRQSIRGRTDTPDGRRTRESTRTRDRGPGRSRTAATGEPGVAGQEAGPKAKGTPIISPVTSADMPAIMDRLTTTDPRQPLVGLINVNTASPSVLKTIPGLSDEDVAAIVSTRQQLSGEEKTTTAWLVTSGALDPETFVLVSNQLTTRSIQFTVDVIGFADHVGTFKRIQTVLEMRGHLSQIRYYRDITSLGIGYPVWDDERSEGFAFID